MKAMSYKKAQTNLANLGNIAMALVVAAVIIGVMASVLVELQATQDDNQATKATNETFTFINGTKQGFSEGRVKSVVVYNQTHVVTSVTGMSYTLFEDGITFLNDTDETEWSGEADDLNVTITYNIGSEAYNITNTGQSSNLTLANFIPTIAIVAISAIIIGLVLIMFRRR